MNSRASLSDYFIFLLFFTSFVVLFFSKYIGLLMIAGSFAYVFCIKISNMKKGHCSICNKKLTFDKVPTNGRLKDGSQLCKTCLLRVSNKIYSHSKKYDLFDAKEEIRHSEKAQEMDMKKWSKPILDHDEEVVYYLLCEYDESSGYLVLTDKRLLFIYLHPFPRTASSGTWHKIEKPDGTISTYEQFSPKFIFESVAMPEIEPKVLLVYANYEDTLFITKETWKTKQMAKLITEKAEQFKSKKHRAKPLAERRSWKEYYRTNLTK